MRTILLFAAAVALAGCQQQSPPASAPAPDRSAVAVLDIDEVAKALGSDVALKDQLEQAGQQMTGQLTDYANKLRDQIKAERDKIGESPSAEDQQRLAQLAVEAQRRVQQGQAEARQKAQELRGQLIARFREQVAPFAERVARDRGASVVVTTGSTLWHESSQDITQAVIDAMREAGAGAPSSTGSTN